MVEPEKNEELFLFLDSGIYRFRSSNAIFIDPVRILNSSYTRFRVSPAAYYSRSFEHIKREETPLASPSSRKRKRKQSKSLPRNETEESAHQRHLAARPLLLRAHEALLGVKDLLSCLCDIKNDGRSSVESKELLPFVELGKVWQAPLYEMSLYFRPHDKQTEDGGMPLIQCGEREVVPIFNNLVVNKTSDDLEAEFHTRWYIIPRESCFYMSDLGQIHNLIPDQSDHGFNLIVIDPPWENKSAYQKSVYSVLPNRYFLSLPIKQLSHTEGALVALWITNREKLQVFVEKELFPIWGVRYVARLYWLKVKLDGSLIGDLDLFHHRPYECLLLGYSNVQEVASDHHSAFKRPQDNQVIISVPGDYSRKPPIGSIQPLIILKSNFGYSNFHN
ncbi:PREDICTED: methyltransferase-like protein 2 isoform X2 [Nelumbo nucifera]|uniref:Methyltransferase-like protein 2 isoform X2 n=1 Tax=Nelumbo nucifera TaxID=4432 RepID=A0A1U7ZHB1_NELNU|nr:PREDICTED: methyltransferase-like protein 2 isoform X2 [Nelumbo nucifera]